MSRTIRRKNAYKPWWLLRTHEKNEEGIYVQVPRPEKEATKILALYHSDREQHSSAGKWFRAQEHVKMRTLVKGELARFWKDNEYEIQVERRMLNDYWD